jgi:PAS domain S-box-containing protein
MIVNAFISLLLLALCNLAVGAYVLRRAPGVAANRSLSFLAAAVSLWTLGIAFVHHTHFDPVPYTRLTFAAASLMPLALLFVLSTFPNRRRLAPDAVTRICATAGTALSLLSFSPLLVSAAWRDSSGLHLRYGLLHPIFGLYVAICVAWSIRLFIPRYRASAGLVRLQFRYFVTGLLLPTTGIIITNLLLPLLYRSPHSGRYGPYFGLLFTLSTAHALIRYRLLDIRLVLRHGASVVLATLASAILTAAFVVALLRLVDWPMTTLSLPLLIIATMAVAIVFQPLHALITRLLDIYAYRRTDDYRRTLRSVSETLRTILDPDTLSTFLVTSLLQAMRAESVGLYIGDGRAFRLKAFRATPHFDRADLPTLLPATSPIATFLAHSHTPLVVDELPYHAPPHQVAELTTCPWAILMPILTESCLIGIIAVGPKLSGDPYFADDIDLLSTLTNQSAIALANANLYKDVVLSHEYVQNVLATIESGVVAVTTDHSVTLFNTAAERLTGLPATNLIGARCPDLPQPLGTLLESALSVDRPRLHEEATLVTADHRVLPVVCSTSVLRDQDRRVLGAVLVFSDLTQVKELDAAKRRADRLASLTALASGIAHEIKNPLVAIRTFAELLPERFSDEDFRHGFSTLVVREINRLDNLVRRLRTLATPPSPHLSPIDLRDPIADTLMLLSAELAQKHISITTDYGPGLPLIAGDYDQLKQLFLNLFLNSIEAIGDHGRILIRLTPASCDTSRPALTAQISDTGCGIPPTVLNRVFDPFVTSKATGSGLGLAICRGICDSHGASIQARNLESGIGATVSINFPAEAVSASVGILQSSA